jgi:pilus assembly protein CpaB
LTGNKSATRVLLAKVTVIAVGPTTITPPANAAQANPESQPRAMLTLALTQAQAEKIIFAQGNGTLYLGLLNDKSQVRPDAGINGKNVFA